MRSMVMTTGRKLAMTVRVLTSMTMMQKKGDGASGGTCRGAVVLVLVLLVVARTIMMWMRWRW